MIDNFGQRELLAQLELSELQIIQLQEELEHYYVEYMRLKDQPPLSNIPSIGYTSEFHVLLSRVRKSDPDFGESEFKRLNATLNSANEVLSAENVQLACELQILRQEKDRLVTELGAVFASRESLATEISELEAKYEEEKSVLEQHLSETNDSLNSVTSRFNLFEASQKKEIEFLQNKLTESEESRATITLQLSELEALRAEEIESLQARLAESERARELLSAKESELQLSGADQIQSLEAKILELNHANDELNVKLGDLESECFEAHRAGDLAQKLLVKSQADLDDLRGRFSEKVASEKELIDLVQELREKLKLASQYYFELQMEHPELFKASDDF